MRLADFAIRNVPDSDAKTYEVTVKPGDSLDRIATANGSTVEMMRILNPSAHMLRPGQMLTCQKAAMRRVIVGRKFITTANIAHYYNGGGDPFYRKKLDYVLPLIRQRNTVKCAQR